MSPLLLWRQRIGYGVSDFACNLIWQIISLYLLYYYVDVMKLDAAAIGIMFLVTRFIDGATDLLVGYCIDHTHTRWGQSRPYFLFGAIPFAIFAYLCFAIPTDIDHTWQMVYAYVTYIGLSFMYTIVNIPMASILPALSDDTNERTALSTSRKFFAFLGATVVSAFALKLVGFFGQGNEVTGFRYLMLLFGVASCIFFFITFFSVRERPVTVSHNASLKETLRSLMHNTPWLIFALNIIFMWGAFFIQIGALIYYFKFVVQSVELSITVATIVSIVPMLANFAVPFLAARTGKRNLYLLSSTVQIIGMLIIFLGGVNHTIIIVGAIIMAAGHGIKESIYFSMQADPVDYGEWKTGINTAGSLSAINGFIGKVAQALAGGLSGLLLSMSGYDANATTQSPEAMSAITWMYIFVPMALMILSIITMSFYRLDKIFPKIKAELLARQHSAEQAQQAETSDTAAAPATTAATATPEAAVSASTDKS